MSWSRSQERLRTPLSDSTDSSSNSFPYNSFPVLSALGGYIFGQSEEGKLLMDDIGLDSVGMILGATLIDWLIEEGLMPAEVPGRL